MSLFSVSKLSNKSIGTTSPTSPSENNNNNNSNNSNNNVLNKRLNSFKLSQSFSNRSFRNNSNISNASGISDNEEDNPLTSVTGCLSWQVEITKDRRKNMKFIYLDPLSGLIFQQGETSQKSFSASNIVEVSYINDESINVTIKLPSEVLTKTRVYTFNNSRVATEFKNTIEYINEFGEFIKIAFKAISNDNTGKGFINNHILYSAMLKQDIEINMNEINKM